MRLLVRHGHLRSEHLTDDALQQARLYVGESVRRWRPLEGAFGPWLTAILFYRMTTWLRSGGQRCDLSGGAEGADEHSPEVDPDEEALDRAVYEEPPEGYGNPADEAARLEQSGVLRRAVAALRDPGERALLTAVYGLDGNGGMTVDDYSLSVGLSRRSGYRTLGRALRNVAQKLERTR